MIRTSANNKMIVGGSLMPDLVLVEAIQFSGLSDVGGAAGFGPEHITLEVLAHNKCFQSI